eukprot:CAMPEP_0119192126 /NCGR_PEP_ID=MMETSP1316-20130426/2718_1 /TAXON_ID=41880 /ORGANISM="Pycnococcus provasolii, Strain RCC2336" /LENGTH=37 /DNA_ID= /DNA_START= /DNA_END= /DNA_ORIENTATION=
MTNKTSTKHAAAPCSPECTLNKTSTNDSTMDATTAAT